MFQGSFKVGSKEFLGYFKEDRIWTPDLPYGVLHVVTISCHMEYSIWQIWSPYSILDILHIRNVNNGDNSRKERGAKIKKNPKFPFLQCKCKFLLLIFKLCELEAVNSPPPHCSLQQWIKVIKFKLFKLSQSWAGI